MPKHWESINSIQKLIKQIIRDYKVFNTQKFRRMKATQKEEEKFENVQDKHLKRFVFSTNSGVGVLVVNIFFIVLYCNNKRY